MSALAAAPTPANLDQSWPGSQYSFPPVIVYTGRYSRSIIVKGARSPERLLDEVTLFLHQVESSLPAAQQRLLASARQREAVFAGRRILIVEDDVRNIFALTKVLAIHRAGGQCWVQAPESAVASAMPRAALATVPEAQVLSLKQMAVALAACRI